MPPDITPNLLVGGRADLARVLDARGLKTAIEVGTDRGCFAREFLDKWHGEMLYCVDPYLSYIDMPWDRQGDLLLAVAQLACHATRVRFIKATSIEAAGYFVLGEPLPQQVGMVYIDGDHHRGAVLEDLHLWWPLVQPGGLLAGDDFQIHSVRDAVMEFAMEQGRAISLISDYNRAHNWLIEKPL